MLVTRELASDTLLRIMKTGYTSRAGVQDGYKRLIGFPARRVQQKQGFACSAVFLAGCFFAREFFLDVEVSWDIVHNMNQRFGEKPYPVEFLRLAQQEPLFYQVVTSNSYRYSLDDRSWFVRGAITGLLIFESQKAANDLEELVGT